MQRKFLSGLFFCIAVCSLAHAQTLQLWTWNAYKMKFKIPDDMNIKESTADKFEATNNAITIDIYPRKGENLTYNGMKKAIVNWAGKTGLTYSSYDSEGNSQPIYMKNINGYWGCAIDGSKDASSASMLLLVDPNFPDISFYVWIAYQEEYYHDVVQMIKSFEPY